MRIHLVILPLLLLAAGSAAAQRNREPHGHGTRQARRAVPALRPKRPAFAPRRFVGPRRARTQTVYIRVNEGYTPSSAAQPQTVYFPIDNGYAPYSPAHPALISNYETLIAPPEEPAAPQPQCRSDVDAPGYQVKEHPDSFAVVVGVENYSSLPKADFAACDAQAVRDHLKSLGYPVRNTMFLADNKAVRSGLEKYVDTWLPKQVGKDSRVFFYFSGHGAPDPKTGQTYLLPWDADPKYLDETGYPMQKLLAKLDALPAKQVVVVLDACFSGAGGRSVLAEGTRPLVTKVDLGRGSAKHLVLFTASGADEITGTVQSQGHGLFTYYFLKGLNGAARGSQEGVTVQDLYDYLRPQVEDAARLDNRDQSPQLFVPPEGQRRLLIKDLR
ncbi:MAG: caspase family protein [Elusimicrobia bacterium]|nr:caspase family protein [Elusimicrobiota bacterium]